MRSVLLIIMLFFNTAIAEEVEIGGLVLDRTFSRFGKDFYRQFTTLWQEVKGTQGVNLVLIERQMPRSGTQLNLQLNNRTIFVTYFGRRKTEIKPQVERAIYAAIDGIAQTRMSQDSEDLAASGY